MKCSNQPFLKNISILYRMWHIFFQRDLENLWIPVGQIPFLRILWKFPAISQDEISKLLYIDKATTAKALKCMEKSELIFRKKDENDKRMMHIFLTQNWKKLLPEIHKSTKKLEEIFTKWFSTEEIKTFEKLSEKMSENAMEFHAQKP